MDPERWRRIERIYHEALDQPPGARAGFVQEACGTDPVLLSEVQSLIECHAQSSQFLETPALHEAASRLADSTAMQRGAHVGHYEVRELLAVGGMGEVYRAWDQVLERDVALKVLREGIDGHARTPADLRHEAQAAARLTHPNICTVHEVYEFEGRAYLVMEYVAGPTLTQLLDDAPLPLERVLRYGIEVADALAQAHDRGVLHKDLKSANVMVTESDHIKVVDFGIARRLDAASVAALTRGGAAPSHTLSGTPAYMAPELLCGQPAERRSDIWALGVLLHEMITRELPFAGQTEYELAGAILHEPPRPLPDTVPRAFRLVIERCLAKNRAERFGSAAEVRQALSAVFGTIGREEEPRDAAAIAGDRPRPARPAALASLRSRRARVGLAVVLLAGFGGGWWALQHRREPVSPGTSTPLPVLAVLPFRLEGVSLGDQDLGVGIADSIIARLSAVRSLRVLQIGSVVTYRDGQGDPAAIARHLGATHVLSGTARRVADRYAVDLRLIRTDGGSDEWHETMPVTADGLLKLEERVAEGVVRVFDLGLSDTERDRLTRPHTTNTAAQEEYLKGRTAVLRAGEEAVDAAENAFRRALQHDPNFPAAQAGLAMALVRRPWYASSPDESRRRKEAAMRAALQAATLDPLLAQTHEALAAVYRFSEFEWEQVIRESVRALELSPSLELPHYNLATAFYHLGLFDLSDRAALAGLAANPRTRPEYIRNRGRSALYDGRFETAAEFLAESERTSDDGPRWMLGETWYYLGERDRSLALLEKVRASPQHIMRDRAGASLAAFLAADGRREEARRRLKALIASPLPDHHVSHRIGTTYAQLREADEAVRWLQRAVETGFPCYTCFEKDPLLDPIRRHPSFQRFLAELRPTADLRRSRYSALAVPRF